MRQTRRQFFNDLLWTSAASAMLGGHLSATVSTPSSGQSEQASTDYRSDIFCYYADGSAPVGKTLSSWIEGATREQIQSAQLIQADFFEQGQLYAAVQDEVREKRLVLEKQQKSPPPSWRGVIDREVWKNNVEGARTDLELAEKNLHWAKIAYDSSTKQMSHLAQQHGVSSPAKTFPLVPTWTGELQPDVRQDRVTIYLCALHTSNRGAGDRKPWNRKDKDVGMLYFAVDYVVPAHPQGCYPQQYGSSKIIYDFLSYDDALADGVPYERIFKDLPIAASGELGLKLQVLDIADPNDRNHWQKFLRGFLEVWKSFKGLSFAEALHVGRIEPFAMVAEFIQSSFLKSGRNHMVWDRTSTPVIFSKQTSGGTFPLKGGLYVLADGPPDLNQGDYVLHPTTFKVANLQHGPLRRNYLVFGIEPAA